MGGHRLIDESVYQFPIFLAEGLSIDEPGGQVPRLVHRPGSRRRHYLGRRHLAQLDGKDAK